MKKVVTGAAIVASLFFLSGCGKSESKKQNTASISSSKERVSSSMAKESKKEASEKVDDARYAVNNLFEEKSDTYGEEYDYNKFMPTTVSDVENVEANVDALPQSAERTRLQKLVSKAMAHAKGQEPDLTSSESKAIESSLAKYRSESIDKELSSTKASSSTKTTARSTSSHYEKVDLETFATETDKYIGKNVETSGEVAYIQKNPDNKDIYYVVILPKDDHASSGYSYGTVTEINVDTFDETNINEGDNITVKGGALTSTIKLNGKTLKSDIVVDSVSVN